MFSGGTDKQHQAAMVKTALPWKRYLSTDMNISTESHLALLAVKGKAILEPSLLLARKFCIRKNKNKY